MGTGGSGGDTTVAVVSVGSLLGARVSNATAGQSSAPHVSVCVSTVLGNAPGSGERTSGISPSLATLAVPLWADPLPALRPRAGL